MEIVTFGTDLDSHMKDNREKRKALASSVNTSADRWS
jgi:hypothetical protein